MKKTNLNINNYSSIENYFIEFDRKNKNYLHISSKFIFFKLKKELEKRKVNFRITDLVSLFEKNMEILTTFNSKNHKIIPCNSKKGFKIKYTSFKNFSISNFNNLSDEDKFNTIFDNIILSSPKINKEKYTIFFKNKRQANENFRCIKYVNQKNLIKFKYNRKLKSNIKFNVRKKKNADLNIIVLDLEIDELEYLFKIISVIFKNHKFKISISKDIYKLTKYDESTINIFLTYDSSIITYGEWLNENRHILSIKNLHKDLYSLLSTNPNILFLSKNTKHLVISDKKSIYNQKSFVSNRISTFIDLLEKGVQ
ncbi:hypothetical protein [Oceanivirga miroungae]|uniref:Uncharacterized protein n=1 Tax=Oceanivirga miroungae TaxID=1130046 RepID=A0A6I8M4U2_9FUSO|nr:hypothetical protein [Oceanivirga miroungae]VWL84924.1 hypothetical protein OMES3154_00181 [Oceanivirga miroungae]